MAASVCDPVYSVNTMSYARRADNRRMGRKTPGDVLNELLRERGMNANQLARATRTHQPTLYRILEGDSKNPRSETLQPYADFFGVTLAQIRGEEPLDADSVDPILERRDPSNGGAELHSEKVVPIGTVPLISWVQAGPYSEAADPYEPGDGERMIPVYDRRKLGRRAFALRVRGDSMVNPMGDPSFPPGTIVIVDPDAEAQPNRFVIARVEGDDEATFKQLVKDAGRYLLKPLNPAYPTIQVDESTRICGVVVRIAERSLI